MRLLLLCLLAPTLQAQDVYFPPRGEWATAEAAAVGMEPLGLAAAVDAAQKAEAATPTDLRAYIGATLANEPHGAIVGPTADRGPMTGVVVKGGRVVAAWGDPERVDMTFSATKSYMSTTVGLAWGDGLIPDLDAPVGELVKE